MSTGIDQWLIEGAVENELGQELEVWEASFDVERQLVYSKLGPYKKLFVRPKNFVQRFYHTLYPILIEDWEIIDRLQLYDGFCTLDVNLELRFQATFEYAQSQVEILSELNEHIKATYHSVILDIIQNKLFAMLPDDQWVQSGLGSIEKSIEFAVNEMLVINYIQAQSTCHLSAEFTDFPDVKLGKEHLYLSVLKKSYEVSEQQREEHFRQDYLLQEQELTHKQQQLEQLKEQADIDQQKQAQDAEAKKQLLLDQEQQQQVHLLIEKRLHIQKVEHDNQLKSIEFEGGLREKQRQDDLLREDEQRVQSEQLAHQRLIVEKQLQADMEKGHREQESRLEAKNKEQALQIEHEHQQKQFKFDMDVANKKREELGRMEIQEESYAIKKNSGIYLRREIELLELDKKRLELEAEIKATKSSSSSSGK